MTLKKSISSIGSWQDLKDHMREAGDVCYTDVYKDGTGVVEFMRYEDMTYAARKLDDSKFRSHEGETSYIRVKMDPKYVVDVVVVVIAVVVIAVVVVLS